MGRSRSRRRRGKSGGQGSGGSGKGKGTGGSRGRSSGTRGGAGSGGSGKGKGTGGSRGRSNNTRGGQSTANRNQNKKARRTVKSVKKAISKVSKNVSKSVRNVTRGLAAKAGTHLANSQYNNQLKKANWTTRDMSKLTPQQQRHYARLSKITGRDYSTRIPGMRINLSADALARFGKFQDAGWYKGLTKAFPGIKSLKINKQLYSNPLKKGWHSSQRMGRGHGETGRPPRLNVGASTDAQLKDLYQEMLGRDPDRDGFQYWKNEIDSGRSDIDGVARSFKESDEWKSRQYTTGIDRSRDARILPLPGTIPGSQRPPSPPPPTSDNWKRFLPLPGTTPGSGNRGDMTGGSGRGLPPQVVNPELKQDWLSRFYRDNNIGGVGGVLDDEARNYWTKEAQTRGKDKVLDTIRGTAKANKTWGGPTKPRRIDGPGPIHFGRPFERFNPKKHHRDGGIRKAWKAKTKRKGGQRSGKAVPRNVAMSLAKSTASTFR